MVNKGLVSGNSPASQKSPAAPRGSFAYQPSGHTHDRSASGHRAGPSIQPVDGVAVDGLLRGRIVGRLHVPPEKKKAGHGKNQRAHEDGYRGGHALNMNENPANPWSRREGLSRQTSPLPGERHGRLSNGADFV
jgi:hypothetical protein